MEESARQKRLKEKDEFRQDLARRTPENSQLFFYSRKELDPKELQEEQKWDSQRWLKSRLAQELPNRSFKTKPISKKSERLQTLLWFCWGSNNLIKSFRQILGRIPAGARCPCGNFRHPHRRRLLGLNTVIFLEIRTDIGSIDKQICKP